MFEKILLIIVLVISCSAACVKLVYMSVTKFKEYRKKAFIWNELLVLNKLHPSAFCFYKLIPGDYERIIKTAELKGIIIDKKEIQEAYAEFLKPEKKHNI